MTEYFVEGDAALKITEKQDNFTEWMYSGIKPFIRGNILEVGSGVGAYSKKIIRDFGKNRIWLSELDSKYVEKLGGKFPQKNVHIIKLDITNATDLKKIKPKADTIIALNVLEHIKDDAKTLKKIFRALNKKGTLILLVPAHKCLFNSIDRSIGHFRRYTRGEVISKSRNAGFQIKSLFYFNMFAILGWYMNGNLLRKKIVNEQAFGLFNKLVPALKFLENRMLHKVAGISLVCILTKKTRKK